MKRPLLTAGEPAGANAPARWDAPRGHAGLGENDLAAGGDDQHLVRGRAQASAASPGRSVNRVVMRISSDLTVAVATRWSTIWSSSSPTLASGGRPTPVARTTPRGAP